MAIIEQASTGMHSLLMPKHKRQRRSAAQGHAVTLRMEVQAEQACRDSRISWNG
jgi:hypothetical protein